MLRKGTRLEAYRFMEQHGKEFGIRWLLRRLGICPNAYYNYRKHRKAGYYAQKEIVKAQIRHIYHAHNGVAGYPYDNAPMKRYFNTLKNECIYLYEFHTEEALYQAVEEFAYVTYNHVRPHSHNGYRTPYQARTDHKYGN